MCKRDVQTDCTVCTHSSNTDDENINVLQLIMSLVSVYETGFVLRQGTREQSREDKGEDGRESDRLRWEPSLLALNGGGRFLSPSSPLSSLLCSLVSWETLSALLSKLKYYGLTGLLMQLTPSKLGFRGTWLPWRNVRSRLYDGAWERWRIVCLAALSVEDIDIYLFGTMITGILLIGLGSALGYRRIQKTGTAVQSPTRLPVWLKLWEKRSALRLRP